MSASADPNLDILRISNEALHRFVLNNGMVCLVKEDHSAPVVAVQIWVGTGAVDEEENLGAGLSHYMEHMIFKGTATRGPSDISKQIDDAGGDINAYTANDRTVFHADLPSKNWRIGVDVLSDAVMNASLPEEEWAREKDVILREFAMGYDDPDRVMHKLLWATAYRVHPYKYPVIGHEEIFRTMTRDQLMAFKQKHYVPDNMIVVIAGDVPPGEAEAYLRNTFKDFARRPRAPIVLPTEPPQLSPREARQAGAFNVSRLQWAYHSVSLNDPDAPVLDMLSTIVGSGRSSRLVSELREKQKLVFEIDAWSYTPKYPGLFGISAVFDPTNEASVVRAIQKEIDGWLTGDFSTEEIEKARRMMLVSELGALSTMSGQASNYGSGEFYAGDPRFSEIYLQTLNRVDATRLKDVARRYLRPENRTLILLTPETASADAVAAPAAVSNRVQMIILSNGVALIVREDHRLPFIYICAALGGGLLTENTDNNGITQLMGDLLTCGTSTRSAAQIALDVENLGGSLSPFAGRNSFGLMAQGLSQDAEALMGIFGDCLLNPTFPADEIEKQRTSQIAGIQQQYEQPMFRAQENLRALLFPDHPYQFTPIGREASVAKLTREQISDQHRRYLTSGNIALSVFGDVTEARAKELVEKYLAGIPKGRAPTLAPVPPVAKLPARRETREPREQAIVLLGYPGIDLKDERMDALNVMSKAMSGLSSDLGIEIREKRGLVYYVGAFSQPGLQPGLFALYAGTRLEAAADVEQLMRAQVERIARDGLRDEEWQRAREQILADNDMNLQNNAQLGQGCALNEMYGLGYQYVFDMPRRLAALTAIDIQAAAASILNTNKEAVSIVLPEEKKP